MTSRKRIFISAGELSGDIHAAGLVRELSRLDTNLEIYGLGGDHLQQQGVELLYHTRDLATMGFWEVARKIGFFLKVKRNCSKTLREKRPDLAILTDYPGLNLNLARTCHELKISTAYYILPQVWAWKSHRVKALKKYCEMLISILPFEAAFFEKYDAKVEYIGHPLLDAIGGDSEASRSRTELRIPEQAKLIALLPGSRIQELKRNLSPMLAAVKLLRNHYPDLRGIIIQAHGLSRTLYDHHLGEYAEFIGITDRDKYHYIQAADVAVVASGTATLETALCGTPAIVIYRTSPITFMLAKRLIKIDMIALANLVAGAKVFPELLQRQANPIEISFRLREILDFPSNATEIKILLHRIREKLQPSGAYARGARLIYERFLR